MDAFLWLSPNNLFHSADFTTFQADFNAMPMGPGFRQNVFRDAFRQLS